MVDSGHQLISKLEERDSDICKYQADLSAPPESRALPESTVLPESTTPPQATMPSESAMPSGFEVTSNESYMLDREVSPVNSCVFDLRGDIDHKLPEEADSTTLDEFTQSNTHEEPTRGSVEAEVPTMDAIQRNSTTGTSSAMPLREVGGNTEVGNETSLGTRNAKRLKAGQNFDDSEVVDLDFFEGPSDSSETEDTPPASSGKKKTSQISERKRAEQVGERKTILLSVSRKPSAEKHRMGAHYGRV